MKNNGYRELYIFGGGDFSKEISDTLATLNRERITYRLMGFIDDDPDKKGKLINGFEVLGDMNYFLGLKKEEKPHAVIGISNPGVKERIAEKLEGKVVWATLIHPSAVVSPHATIEEGCVVQPFAFISANVVLHRHSHVNVGACIGHDAILGEYSSVMVHVNISGHSDIGRRVFVSSGVTTIPGISVGEGTLIGAGAVVTKDLPSGVKAYGNPCRLAEK